MVTRRADGNPSGQMVTPPSTPCRDARCRPRRSRRQSAPGASARRLLRVVILRLRCQRDRRQRAKKRTRTVLPIIVQPLPRAWRLDARASSEEPDAADHDADHDEAAQPAQEEHRDARVAAERRWRAEAEEAEQEVDERLAEVE